MMPEPPGEVRKRENTSAHRPGATPPPVPSQRTGRKGSGKPPKVPVPYITQWSSEEPAPVRPVQRHGRLAFADERRMDRDSAGVLWRRIPSTPGRGKPVFGAVHAIRQRTAMAALRCQVCAGPADRNRHGTLWLVGEDAEEPGSWPQGMETMHPPVCLPCAALSLRACPHLRRPHAALRVRRCTPAGVYGALYGPGFPGPVLSRAAGVRYGSAAAGWIVAGQLVMRLDDFTRTEVEAELAGTAPSGR